MKEDALGRRWLFAVAAILVVTGLVEHLNGRVLWCSCGSLVPWSFDIWSRHNSQHLIDPYTLTHILHGVVFYGLTRLVPGRRVPLAGRAILVAALESGWELLENSRMVIERYRAATISLDYYGDSVINSLSDIGACLAGFVIASKLPWKYSVVLYIAVELVLLLWVRDGLTLNVIMLVRPIEAIKLWQSGLAPSH